MRVFSAMKTILTIFSLIAYGASALADDKTPDLTGADAAAFKAHLGHAILLRGRLSIGMQGMCLFRATPKSVVFYVVPSMPASGSYTYPNAWMRLVDRDVRVVGALKFRSFGYVRAASATATGWVEQTAPDYYYMVLQAATIAPVETK